MGERQEQESPRRGSAGRRRWLIVGLVLGPLALGCSSGNKSAGSGDSAAELSRSQGEKKAGEHSSGTVEAEAGGAGHSTGAAPATGSGAKVGEVASRFSFTTLSGSTFVFPTGKPTAIWFTADGCRSCIPKAQALDRLKGTFGDRLAVLGVDINPTETEAVFQNWAKEVGNPRFELAMDKDSRLTLAWGIKDTSTVVITDASGKVVYHSAAGADEAKFRAALAEAGLS